MAGVLLQRSHTKYVQALPGGLLRIVCWSQSGVYWPVLPPHELVRRQQGSMLQLQQRELQLLRDRSR